MYHYLIGVSIFKSFTPYFRKHIFSTLSSEEFLYVNTLMIFLLVFLYFIYKISQRKIKTVHDIFKNYKQLTLSQFLAILFISSVAVLSSVFVFEFDRNFNTPLMNSIYLETLTTISLILIAIFLYKEKYTYMQITGFFLVILGIFLISNK
jgi:drug/metabolite transporter (DMT)-like permease